MRFIVLLVCLTLWLIASAATAQTVADLDSDKPIEITADTLEVLQENQKAIFSGNVLAKQGNVSLRSSKMTVFYRQSDQAEGQMGAVSRIDVDGNVMMATPEESAKAQKGIYNVDEERILLKQDVVLTRGENVLKGEQLDYNLKTGKSLLTGGVSGKDNGSGSKTGGRVKGIFLPKGDS